MKQKYKALKLKLLALYPKCEVCHFRSGTDLHHCIEKRRKGHPGLDCEINLEVVCNQCHIAGKANSKEHALEFVKKQIARGHDVLGWYDGLKLRTRRFPNLRGMIDELL